ncbi:GDSL-like Lipase/Acylhydrolase family protein [Nocardioides exalbidus]|uniref:GDSL-like Lipase/Acylhydrolase family protein n=1 Tax=Nocardioides exalbidus TaxID=402596 RepID=A0A1H4TV21_9ACTN|nr:GDSL-like Lipase/Acylhydrolase family protein [Nocardioides exalbidus]
MLWAGLAATLLVTSACSAGGTAAPGDDGGLPDPVIEAEVTSDVDYVALGDSFSAGPFIGTMRTDPAGCARSKDNYPAFLADWLDVKSYTDVTCSAATTQDLTGTMALYDGGTAPPQLDAVTADTDLVTLGMGGNDFGIYDSLIRCQDGRLAVCPVADLRTDAGKVAGNIRKAVRDIRALAPEADVYVVGYPDILPTEGTCKAVGVQAEALGPIAEVAVALNASLREGATAAGASYVDMEAVSDGHDVCAGGRAWINGPRFRIGVAAPFHPKINGMRAVAATVYEQVTGDEPDVTEYAEPDPDVVVLNEG